MKIFPAVAIVPSLFSCSPAVAARHQSGGRTVRPDRRARPLCHDENALYRDVFSARIGTLRSYDPLVREIGVLHGSLDRLRQTPPSIAKRALQSIASPHPSTTRKSWSNNSRAPMPYCTIPFRCSDD